MLGKLCKCIDFGFGFSLSCMRQQSLSLKYISNCEYIYSLGNDKGHTYKFYNILKNYHRYFKNFEYFSSGSCSDISGGMFCPEEKVCTENEGNIKCEYQGDYGK